MNPTDDRDSMNADDVIPVADASAAGRDQETTVDVVVLGAGPVGMTAATALLGHGLQVAVVEIERIGGECAYYGCIPSKALLRSGQVVRAARAVPGAAEAVTGRLDAAAVIRRRNSLVHDYDDTASAGAAQASGIVLVRGRARLAGRRRVEVATSDGGSRTLLARSAVVVATGTGAFLPPTEGLADAAAWTNRGGTSADHAPRRLAIIGGGAVAVELATAWGDLGSEQITILDRGERLLSAHEPLASAAVAAGLTARGVDVRLNTSVSRVQRESSAGPVTLTLDDGSEVVADELLVAAGRRPHTRDIGMESVGLEPGAELAVDTTGTVVGVPGAWLYAVGDVTGEAELTHMGKYQARAVVDTLVARAAGRPVDDPRPWGRYATDAERSAVPQVVFADPELALVGLTEAAARQAGLRVQVADAALDATAGGALFASVAGGFGRLVVDADRQVVVGATFVGPDVVDLLHAATVAIVGEVPLSRLWHAVATFPTVSEVWLDLLTSIGRESAALPSESAI